jgi:EAL domain-containing protein (putative c-di-GMP-specific phosphodiesterase class I)
MTIGAKRETDFQPQPKPRLLIVDDEQLVRYALGRLLGNAYDVQTVADGAQAAEALLASHFDVVLSDVNMPGVSGLEMLRQVRERDLDTPVILMTGAPNLTCATEAVAQGAFRYLFKPVESQELLAVLSNAVKIGRLAAAKRAALEMLGSPTGIAADRAGLEGVFRRALPAISMAYQPIVSWAQRRIVGYEALLRSSDPTLSSPWTMLQTAEQLGRLPELGRTIRARVSEDAARLPEGCDLFVNLHPHDLLDDSLYLPGVALAAISKRVVLEITERASLSEIPNLKDRLARLREIGFRIAIDDLGAGYAGLAGFAQLEPEVVKIDMALVRDIHLQPIKQTLVRSIVSICRDLGITVLAEGVENAAEREAVVATGCDLIQGYFFAKPAAPFTSVTF